ncbi:MAG: hypothetical protein U5P41_16290 [Gammaproteobacteria bacterium]|nr:hypothetical protein [Gammaproteobacteria bacterium]
MAENDGHPAGGGEQPGQAFAAGGGRSPGLPALMTSRFVIVASRAG